MFELDAFGVLLLAIWVFAIFDVIKTDRELCRNLPKELWLLLVIILPDVGAIAWFIMGRPVNARFRPGSTESRAPGSFWATPSKAIGPEDSPEFMKSAEERRLRAWEEELRRREEDIRRREQGDQR
ncbi:MAG: PLDc_N domain-containing protein [Actinobacteria bacterium]|nr:MAG: PLDc_N domain-containing protein [Actinomycetota bacterium]